MGSKQAKQQRISDKIAVLRREGKPADQSAAIAYSMERAHRLRPGGVYVRAPKRGGSR